MLLDERRPKPYHLCLPSAQKDIKDVVQLGTREEAISFFLTLLIEVKESEGEASLSLCVVSLSCNQTSHQSVAKVVMVSV